MSTLTPIHADVRRQIKDRLLNLSPRAFETFAGDLLQYVGLQHVAVTRYIGDGGIDAHGDLVAASNLVRISTGVQVKRHRSNVQRPDIDRFIGALGGRFRHGIFITTAGYAPQARQKASSSLLVSIDTVDGDQVAALNAPMSNLIITTIALSLELAVQIADLSGWQWINWRGMRWS